MNSSFLAACKEGNLDKIKAILQTDAISRSEILSEKDDAGWNCLHLAAWFSHIECVKYLLSIKALDINAETNFGENVFDLALNRIHIPSIELTEMLLKVNNDFVNSRGRFYLSDPLEYAIRHLHIDFVKLLIHFGGKVDEEKGTLLHLAAGWRRAECFRYLVFELKYDPCIRYNGVEAWYYFVATAIVQLPSGPSKEEIELSLELLSHIFNDSLAETVQVCFVLLDCFLGRVWNSNAIFMEIVKLLLPFHQRKYFVKKILDALAQLPSNYCLITLTLFETIGRSSDLIYMAMTEESITYSHLRALNELKSYFLQELFDLFLADETFFNEYIAEAIRLGWTFKESKLMSRFCAYLTEYKEISTQKLFNFIKSLIMHEFKFVLFVQPLPSLSPSHMGDHLLNVFVPLSNFVHVPIELIWLFRSEKIDCHYNFNESDNCVDDYNILAEMTSNQFEVVSLMNLSRMSVRKYVFQNYSHYKALSIIYSLNIPMTLKIFLCYNSLNLQF